MYRRLVGSETGLVGLWTLNEATGDQVRDRAASGNDGALAEAAHYGDPDGPDTGGRQGRDVALADGLAGVDEQWR
jgi:hypothetical protein